MIFTLWYNFPLYLHSYLHVLLKKYLFFHISFYTASSSTPPLTFTIKDKDKIKICLQCCLRNCVVLCVFIIKIPGIISWIKQLINKLPFFVLCILLNTINVVIFFQFLKGQHAQQTKLQKYNLQHWHNYGYWI